MLRAISGRPRRSFVILSLSYRIPDAWTRCRFPLPSRYLPPRATQGAVKRRGDVGDDLASALVAGDQVLVDNGHPAGRGRAGVIAVGGRVDVEHGRGPSPGALPGSMCMLSAACGGAAMVCRTGPTCMPIRSSSLSLRYGVAVSPSHRRARICLTASSNAAAGTWWHSSATISPYPAVSSVMSSRRDSVCSVMRSMVPRSFARPPPS